MKKRARISPGYACVKGVCLTCGTSVENQTTGQCINGHDDWINKTSNWKRQQKAEFQFKMDWREIVEKIENKESLNRIR